MTCPLSGNGHRHEQIALIRRLFGNGPTLAQDKDFKAQRLAWVRSRREENSYAIQLRKLCRNIEFIISGGIDPESPTDTSTIEDMLRGYAALITPWAEVTAERMLLDIDQHDRRQWARHARTMSRAIREEIETCPTGDILRRLQDEQVTLIKSLPLQAAERVHDIALKGITEGTRGEDIVADIMQTGLVTRSRAELIAQTEASRASSNFQQARAEFIGSKKYTWVTIGDADVRRDHKELNNKVFDWNDPPVADKRSGTKAHPGCIYRCRCVAIPVLPDEF
jgi:SPP1 gp7 family putative phage head morphogenesis protein